jgi:hypothetical protein
MVIYQLLLTGERLVPFNLFKTKVAAALAGLFQPLGPWKALTSSPPVNK